MNRKLIETALAHARIARLARARIQEARAAGDSEAEARWVKHERANMVCFRMDLDEATARRESL